MIRFLRAFGRALFWLSRFRPLRPLAVLLALLWGFDGAVRMATDAAWFGSMGRAALWQLRLTWQIGIFAAFGVLALGASVAVMRAIARPLGREVAEPPLPRALARWAKARARATRWGWLVLLLGIASIGRTLSAHWPDFALSGARGGPWNEAGADFWVWHAPALNCALGALWSLGLLLGLVALGVGALRSLPFLAARQSIAPRRWVRTLLVIAGALLVLRALGFGLEAARATADLSGGVGDARALEVVLCCAGILGCLGCASGLRCPRPKLALSAALCVALPSVLADIAGRFAKQPVPSSETRATGEAALLGRGGTPTEVPMWDEAALSRVMRAHLARRGERLVAWEVVGISPQSGSSQSGSPQQMRADVVGQAPLSDAWAGHGLTEEGDLSWRSLDLPALSASRRGQPLGPLFFGLNARPLLSGDARGGGVALESWTQKVAWAWRLRDPLLLVEGARAKRLLVFRGARETGEQLAPFWTWDEAVPRRDSRTGSAYFESVAYASTPDLPRALRFVSGPFAGQNAVRPIAVLRMDCRAGQVQIAPFAPDESNNRRPNNPFIARWTNALPLAFDAPAQNAPTPALERVRAGETSVQAWTQSEMGWQKRAVPSQLRAAVERKLSDFDRAVHRQIASDAALQGATPSLWREGERFYLCQPFFTLAPSALEVASFPSQEATAFGFKGWLLGELGSSSLGWGQTFEAARADALKPSLTSASPGASPTPTPPKALNPREVALKALAAQNAATDALKAGRYVESQRHLERAQQLLQPLTHP